MAEPDVSIESRIQSALLDLEGQNKPNIKGYARSHNLPYQRLLARYNGRKSRYERRPAGRKLDEAQESAPCRYIDYLDTIYLHPKRAEIAAAANSILVHCHTDPTQPSPTIGQNWLPRFLARHPEYRVRRLRALDFERKKCLDRQIAIEWFESYKATIARYGIVSDDIWNFDETGFNIGVGKDQWSIIREPKRVLSGGFNTNREYATVVEAVSVTGATVASVVILSAKLLLRRWFDITTDEGLDVTETGYMNNILALQWIRLFHQATKASKKGIYRMSRRSHGRPGHLTQLLILYSR